MKPVKIGIVGCGQISKTYLTNCTGRYKILEVAACADLKPELAKAKAEEFSVPEVCTVEELIQHPGIEIVVNLTNPPAHGPINRAALEAGKSVYVEKPFAVNTEEASAVLALAEKKGLLTGSAPDTFLGTGLQTCRELLDRGLIGTPVTANAVIAMGGPRAGGHPNASVFYKPGAGPLFDMGPYYITALVAILGPVRRVCGCARKTYEVRPCGIKPETPTNTSAVLEFESGCLATLITTYDSIHYFPRLDIYGTAGMLQANDPNCFEGPVYLEMLGKGREKVEFTGGVTGEGRGAGIADMAYALHTGKKHRADGKLAYHVLEIMEAILASAENGKHLGISSTCSRPDPVTAQDMAEIFT